jgi:hypothetical protein
VKNAIRKSTHLSALLSQASAVKLRAYVDFREMVKHKRYHWRFDMLTREMK